MLLTEQFGLVAADLLFPPHCVHCERVGSFLCRHCLAAMQPAMPRHLADFDAVHVCVDFEGPARDAVHALKYEGVRRMVLPLGELLAGEIQATGWPVDVVTAVPLHPTRQRTRGYNQAMWLAGHVALALGAEFAPDALRRHRDTPSQVNLNAAERQANVAGAFAADGALVVGRSVLVVDDVLTTGATLSACAAALREVGVARVFGAAVAGAVFAEVRERPVV